MCGIGGILTSRTDLDLLQICAQMREALAHRGPDDRGIEVLDVGSGMRLGLVHTRLSILDLSAAGHQPMHAPESDSWIVFNGEIYNFKSLERSLPGPCRTKTDTEVILKAWDQWGPAALDRMQGMFAWALYDGRGKTLHLVRDRLGIKPLYVYRDGNHTLLFASELRTLLASGLVPRRLSAAALNNYLSFGAVNAPRTLIDGVESLNAGERWEIAWRDGQLDAPRRETYWVPRFAAPERRMRYEEAVERVRPILLESLSRHMVSDTPVGVFLSGGIDSSSIVGALTHLGYRLQTFSVLFGERGFDESAHAMQIAQLYGTEHRPLQMLPETLADNYQSALDAYDQPSIDGVNTFLIAQAVSRAGMKVALSGLGGDELFAGYDSFRMVSRLEKPTFRWLAHALGGVMEATTPQHARTEKLANILHGDGSPLRNYSVIRQVMSYRRRHALYRGEVADNSVFLPAERADALLAETASCDAVNAHSQLELSVYVGDMLLKDTDQMSMAHPVEVRVPLLDHLLVETLGEIPGKLKLKGSTFGEKKRLLIDALPVKLPHNITHRPKMGFVFPWELWLRNDLKDHITWILTDRKALDSAMLNPLVVMQLWNDFCQGRPGIRYSDILALAHLLHWVRQHRLSR